MFKRVTFILATASILCGCRTTETRKQINGDEMVSALADYIALKDQLLPSLNALRAFDDKRHSVRWQDLREFSFQVVSTNGVRLNYTDASGVLDHRIVFIYARNLTPLPVGSNTVDFAALFTDPKACLRSRAKGARTRQRRATPW